MSNLLINEPPLQVLPSLAAKIGLNEAIVTQQIHYWLGHSKNMRDGVKWVYKTYSDWNEEFPFWSEKTIKRVITSLEKQGVLLSSSKYNKMPMDRTKWYTIDYKTLQSLATQPKGQNDPMQEDKMTRTKGQNDPMQEDKMTPPITIEYTENTTENDDDKENPSLPIPAQQNVFQFYEQNFGLLNPYIADDIEHWLKDFDNNEEVLKEAMRITLENQATWSYTKQVLKNWYDRNIRTPEAIEAAKKERERKRGKNRKHPAADGNAPAKPNYEKYGISDEEMARRLALIEGKED